MPYNKKSLENLIPIDNCSEAINNSKSAGMRYKNIVMRALRNGIAERDIVNRTLDIIEEQLDNGYCKSALKLIEIAKEPDKVDTTININQAVQVNKDDINEAVKIINELR